MNIRNNDNDSSRRVFLRSAAGLALASGRIGQHFSLPLAMGLSGMAGLAAQRAQAADTSGYKALVCLFMYGGNDAHNWVVPVDATGYAQYSQARNALALPLGSLQPITSSSQGAGRAFGMPAELAPLRALYEQGQAAIIANVGPLLRPISKAEFNAGSAVPPRLFSHNDQQSTWQSGSAEGARSGWGGRIGDILATANGQPLFTTVSATGNAVYLAGNNVVQYQVNAAGPVGVNGLANNWLLGAPQGSTSLRQMLADAGATPLQREYTRVVQRAINAEATLRGALANVSVPAIPATPLVWVGGSTTLDKEALARQLRMVAQLIAANQGLGMRRQVFMVSIGGFDTHAHQLRDQSGLMTRVANSVRYFNDTVAALGLGPNVTLFTASDFGRTLASNDDGSDHGWGSHHFAVGGAVRGREIYGRFPVTALGTADDVGSGRLLPSTSVTQFAASLGRWMGLSTTELATVLPNLGQFNAGTMGFL